MSIRQHLHLYDKVCQDCSRLVTHSYTTSFSLGILAFSKKFRAPVRNIYGFVRFADEIVDTFHAHNKKDLLDAFRQETYKAIEQRISLNPVLHSFQMVVHQYRIDRELIDAFLHSMEMDLTEKEYDEQGYNKYIFGSAEVVGLMCLKVFCEGDEKKYQELAPSARKLGAAFQKINFLRDLQSDFWDRGRMYFPSLSAESVFDYDIKSSIEKDIENDFKDALKGIRNLPDGCRLGVYIAYIYFFSLLKKIEKVRPQVIMKERISVSAPGKLFLLTKSYFKYQLNLL